MALENNFAPITEKEKDRLVQALKKVKAMNEVDRAKVVRFALGICAQTQAAANTAEQTS